MRNKDESHHLSTSIDADYIAFTGVLAIKVLAIKVLGQLNLQGEKTVTRSSACAWLGRSANHHAESDKLEDQCHHIESRTDYSMETRNLSE